MRCGNGSTRSAAQVVAVLPDARPVQALSARFLSGLLAFDLFPKTSFGVLFETFRARPGHAPVFRNHLSHKGPLGRITGSTFPCRDPVS